jgi:hypothetical protein
VAVKKHIEFSGVRQLSAGPHSLGDLPEQMMHRAAVTVEATRSEARTRVVLVEARATDRSTFRRREIYEGPIGPDPVGLDAVVTPGGTAATLVPVAGGAALVLRRGGREVRELDRGDLGYLALEDGVTVRASVVNGVSRRYHDLRPPPQGDAGCPRRERFERVLLTDSVEVTQATYPRQMSDSTTVRACLRSVGQDPVVADGSQGYNDGILLGEPLLDGDWVAVPQFHSSRHDGCYTATIATTNLRTGGPSRAVGGSCRAPRNDEPVAITHAGVLAHVAQDQDAWTVVAFASEGPIRVDTGPPGAITGLRADGPFLRWENGGQPRAAQPGG